MTQKPEKLSDTDLWVEPTGESDRVLLVYRERSAPYRISQEQWSWRELRQRLLILEPMLEAADIRLANGEPAALGLVSGQFAEHLHRDPAVSRHEDNQQ